MNFTIRKLQASDSNQFQKLMTQLYLLHTAELEGEKPNLPVIKAEVLRSYKNLLSTKKDACFVAVAGRTMAGFVTVLSGDAKQKGYVDDLFVAARYRQQGVGRLLMNQAFAWFKRRGMKVIELDVHKNNHPALATYKKLGFHKKPPQYDTYELTLN